MGPEFYLEGGEIMTPDIFRRQEDEHLIKYFDSGGGMDITGSASSQGREIDERLEIGIAAKALNTTPQQISDRLSRGEKIHYETLKR